MSALSEAGVDVGEPSAKKQKKLTSCGDIKSRGDFELAFGPAGYSVDLWRDHRMQLGQWGLKANTKRLSEWLRQVAPKLVSAFSLIARNSEAALYPLLVELLLPIMELNNFAVISTTTSVSVDTDAAPDIADSIVFAHTPPSSRTTSAEGTVESATAAQAVPSEQPQQARYLDLQDVAQVTMIAAEVILEIERKIKHPGLALTGRVEIIVGSPSRDSDFADPHAAIECKPDKLLLMGVPAPGFFQACANMIISGARFGVLTNYNEWIFMELLPNKRIVHTDCIDFIASNFKKYRRPDCLQVLAHIFHIMEVPVEMNLMDRIAEIQLQKDAAAASLLADA